MDLHGLISLHYSDELAVKSTMNKTHTGTIYYSVGEASHLYLLLKEEEGNAKANKFLEDLVEMR